MKNLINFSEIADRFLNKPYVAAGKETIEYCKNNAVVEIVKEANKGEVNVKTVKVSVDGKFIAGLLVRDGKIVKTPVGIYMDEDGFNKINGMF